MNAYECENYLCQMMAVKPCGYTGVETLMQG